MGVQKHRGSCHCKKVQFEADIDLEQGTYKCNCSYCAKVRNWGHIVKPHALKWTSGQSDIGIYKIKSESQNEYYFCKSCGVRMGTKGYIEEIGGDYFSVPIATIDTLSPAELSTLKVQFMNGKDDDWMNPPPIHTYL